MRLRLNSADSLVGTLMVGDAVGEVIESRAADFLAGDIAMGNIGWQEYGVLDAGLLRKIDPSVAPISTSLGILGMPGLTAYFGLFEIGQPIPGDTVVVSAASGAAIEKIASSGRAVICGQIAQYNATSPPQGPRIIPHMLLSRQARMEGFWVGQFEHRNSHALYRLSHRVRDGTLKYKEDVVVGIENSPAAFIGLLNGANLGKLVLQLK